MSATSPSSRRAETCATDQSILTPTPSEPGALVPAPGTPAALPFGMAILCLILAGLGLRPTIVSIGPILPDMIAAFELSHAEASLLTAIPTLLMGLLALPTPRLARRYGRNRVIVAALIAIATAAVARAFSYSTWTLFVSTAGTGVGIAFAGALIPGFVKAEFPTRAASLMGIFGMALSLGSTVAAATTKFLAGESGGWRAAIGFWALPALFGVVAWLYIQARDRGRTLIPQAAIHPLPVRNPTAWLIAAFFACNNVIFYSCISWLAPIYVEFGRASTTAGLLLATFTLAFMVASPVFGFISRNEDRRTWLAASSGMAFLGILWVSVAPTVLPFAAVSLIAFGTGGAFTLSMTLPLDNARTHEEAIAWNAFVILISYLVGAAGPVLVGMLRDLNGGFYVSLWVLAGVAATMLAIGPFLRPSLTKP